MAQLDQIPKALTADTPTIVILAAGASSRFGECKHLASINGKPLVQHLVDRCCNISPAPVYLVSGRYHQPMQEQLHGVSFIYNESWAEGLSSSIKAAVNALPQASSLLFILGDQIALQRNDIDAIYSADPSYPIVCATFGNRYSVPARFARSEFSKLKQLTGDEGARALLKQSTRYAITMPNAAIDIDTQDDLSQYLQDIERSPVADTAG